MRRTIQRYAPALLMLRALSSRRLVGGVTAGLALVSLATALSLISALPTAAQDMEPPVIDSPATAQETPTPPAQATNPSIVGSWHVTVMFEGEAQPERYLATFTTGGSYVQSGSSFESTGHGSWQQQSDQNQYLLTHEVLVFERASAGTIIVKTWANIGVSGDTFTAPFRFTGTLVNGTVVESGRGTLNGRRIGVEAF